MGHIRILVAEDDENILTGLIDIFESEGYSATPARDGKQALEFYRTGKFNLVLLDIMMPIKSGYDVCREIRLRDKDIPIIMLTAKGEEIDKVVGLQLGADDYITKPFGVHELLARVAAVLRRAGKTETSREPRGTFLFGNAEINPRKYSITKSGKTEKISDRELKMLHFFHEHPGEVLTRDQLLNAVWGINYYGTTRTLDQHISKLRKKIEDKSAEPEVIMTVHGVGYQYKGQNSPNND